MYSHPDFQLVVGSFPSYADSDIGASFCGCDCSQFRIKHLFQYLKVIVIAIAGASAVVIGKDIGSNDEEKVRCNGRTLSVLYLAIGLLLGTVLFLLRSPLLSMYRLTLRLLCMQTTS